MNVVDVAVFVGVAGLLGGAAWVGTEDWRQKLKDARDARWANFEAPGGEPFQAFAQRVTDDEGDSPSVIGAPSVADPIQPIRPWWVNKPNDGEFSTVIDPEAVIAAFDATAKIPRKPRASKKPTVKKPVAKKTATKRVTKRVTKKSTR